MSFQYTWIHMTCGKVDIVSFSYSDSDSPKIMSVQYKRIHVTCGNACIESSPYTNSYYPKELSVQYTRTHKTCGKVDIESFSYCDSYYRKIMSLQYTRRLRSTASSYTSHWSLCESSRSGNGVQQCAEGETKSESITSSAKTSARPSDNLETAVRVARRVAMSPFFLAPCRCWGHCDRDAKLA